MFSRTLFCCGMWLGDMFCRCLVFFVLKALSFFISKYALGTKTWRYSFSCKVQRMSTGCLNHTCSLEVVTKADVFNKSVSGKLLSETKCTQYSENNTHWSSNLVRGAGNHAVDSMQKLSNCTISWLFQYRNLLMLFCILFGSVILNICSAVWDISWQQLFYSRFLGKMGYRSLLKSVPHWQI